MSPPILFMPAAACRRKRHNKPHRQIVAEGAAIIDVGAYSSRSNAENVSPAEEMERLRMGLGILRKVQPMRLFR